MPADLRQTLDDVSSQESFGSLDSTAVPNDGGDPSDTTDPNPARPGPVPGSIIGRYHVVEELGSGTMGVVYAAHDPELDRRVAIKLLKARKNDANASQARLQREAQALARLNHPNVVGVYDVGVHAGQLFLAMEYVEGQTLRGWFEAQARPWSAVVKVMIEAGRGLAAAHGVGLIHRDFKPDNVMLHASGRVQVMDFGLARAENLPGDERSPGAASTDLETLAAVPAADGHLTQTGTVMGTPGYMARELFNGRPADVRSDQFAYCVTLYEALYGDRPFPGQTLYRLIQAVRDGRVREPPRGARVPRWLHAILLRGLDGEPERRWPSMLDLLEAIENGPKRQRRRWLVGAALGAGLVAGTWASVRAFEDARRCEDLDVELREAWNHDRRAALEQRFVTSELSYTQAAWPRVEGALDDYAKAWLSARVDTCEAGRSGAQSPTQTKLRVTCLDARLHHFQATLDVLAEADATTLGRASEMVADLPRLDRCADLDALELEASPGLELADASAFERRLAEAEALEKAGQYQAGLRLCAEIEAAAAAKHDERTLARAHLREGILQRRVGDYEASELALLEAYELSEALRMTAEAAESSAQLVFVVGYQLARHEDGRQWAIHAKALARAAATDEAEALYLNNLGALAYAEGKFDETREHWQRALELRERAHGKDHPQVAGSLNNLGVLAHDEGDYEAARRYHEGALAIWAEAFGPEHPQTSYSLNHLGRVALEQGRYDDARSYHEQALAIRERALGPGHSLVGDTLTNLGQLAEREGDYAQALDHYERALVIFEATLGTDHPSVGQALTDRGRALIELGRGPEALEGLERALVILSASEGDPTRLARARLALAEALDPSDAKTRARARELAVQAHEAFLAAGPKVARELAAAEAWLREHP